jgi:hypothetical protein
MTSGGSVTQRWCNWAKVSQQQMTNRQNVKSNNKATARIQDAPSVDTEPESSRVNNDMCTVTYARKCPDIFRPNKLTNQEPQINRIYATGLIGNVETTDDLIVDSRRYVSYTSTSKIQPFLFTRINIPMI